jgi:hypothetical protein
MALALVYDATADEEILDLPNVVKLHDCRDLWAPVGGVLPDSAEWDFAFAKVALGEDVKLSIDSDVDDLNPSPTDPSVAALSDIRVTHRTLATQLEELCALAVQTGSKVWTTRFLSHGRSRFPDIVNDPMTWQENVKDVVRLEYEPRKTIAKLLASTGGGEMVECYVQNDHNIDNARALAKCIRLVDRQQQYLLFLGVDSVPLLNPLTPPPDLAVVRSEIWDAMMFVASHRGRIAIWNGPTTGSSIDYTTIDAGLKTTVGVYAA